MNELKLISADSHVNEPGDLWVESPCPASRGIQGKGGSFSESILFGIAGELRRRLACSSTGKPKGSGKSCPTLHAWRAERGLGLPGHDGRAYRSVH